MITEIKRKPKRILICGSTQGVYGGIEVFMTALAEYLYQHPDFEVALLFKLTRGAQIRDSMRELVKGLPFPVYFEQRGMQNLKPLISEFDLVHTQNVPPDIITVAKVLRKPVVATIHNWRRPCRTLHGLLWKLGHAWVDARTFNSQFVRRTWTSRPESFYSKVIPTVSRLPNEPAPWGGRRGFVFVGRWIPNKGLDDLVRAYAAAGLDPSKEPLVLLGDGPMRESIRELVRNLELKGVDMPGIVTDDEKFRRISSARWLVAPPNTKEDLGLTPIEARALRIPVIASRDGGIPEAAGDNALFFEPGDVMGLAQCLNEAVAMPEDTYRQRAIAGHESLATFLKPLSAYADIYQTLLPRN